MNSIYDVVEEEALPSIDVLNEVETPGIEILQEKPAVNPQDKATQSRRAGLAALAELPYTDTSDSVLEGYKRLYEKQSILIEKNRESSIASRLKLEAGTREVNIHNQAINDNPELSSNIADSLARRLFEDAANDGMIDKEAADSIGTIRGLLNPEMQEQLDFMEATGGFEAHSEILRRKMKLMRMIEDDVPESEHWNKLMYVFDFVLTWLPLADSLANTGNVKVDNVMERWYDWFLSGQRKDQELSEIFSLKYSEEEFDALAPQVMANIKDQVTNPLHHNRFQEIMLLHDVMDVPGVLETNTYNVLDNFGLGYLLFKAGPSMFKITKLLKLARATDEASELLASAMRITAAEGAEAAERKLGISLDEIGSELPFKLVNPGGTVEDGIGLGSEATARLERGKALGELFGISDIKDLNRLNVDELKAATEKAKEILEKNLKRKVENVQVINATEGSTIYTPVMRVTVGKAKGGGFANTREAFKFARSLGVETAARFWVKGAANAGDAVRKFTLRGAEFDPAIISARKFISPRVANDFIINPTKKQLDEIFEVDGKDINLLSTPDGNIIATRLDYKSAAKELGFEPDSYGRGLYHPKKSGNSGYYAFGKGVDSARKFKDRDGQAFKLNDELGVDTTSEASKKLEAETVATQEYISRMDEVAGDLRKATSSDERARAIEWDKPGSKFKKGVVDKLEELKAQSKPKAIIGDDPISGESYIMFDMPINEKGFFAPITDVKAWGPIGRKILNGAILSSEDIFNSAVMAVNRRNKLIKLLKKSVSPKFKALNHKERKFIDELTLLGDQEGKWFSKNQLRNHYFNQHPNDSVMNDRVLEAYRAFINVNDMEYWLRNMELFSIKSTQGFETVRLVTRLGDVPAHNAKVHRDISTVRPDQMVYDVEKGEHFVGAHKYDRTELKKEGYILIESEQPMELVDGTFVKFFATKTGNVEISNLRPTQIGYRAGGHRIYGPRVKHFAKKARTVKQSNTGDEFFINPETEMGGISKYDVDKWVEDMNFVIDLFKRYEADDLTRRGLEAKLGRVLDNPGYPKPPELLKRYDEGKWDTKFYYERVYDRDMPSAYSSGQFSTTAVDEMPGTFANMETVGRMYYAPKGDKLRDFKGEELPVLNVFEAVDKSLMNIANITGFGPYKIKVMEKWVATYRPLLDIPEGASIPKIFNDAQFLKGKDPKLVYSAEQQRTTAKRVMGWTTQEDEFYKGTVRSVIESVDDLGFKIGNEPLRRFANDYINWQLSGNYLSRLRGMAFDMKLGLLNVTQFPMQITTMAAAMAIDPTNGTKAFRGLYYLRAYTARKAPDLASTREHLAKIGTKQFGFDNPDEMLKMMKTLRNEGFLDVNSTHVLANDFSSSAAFNLTGGIGGKINSVREGSRFFFYEAERWNRTIAWHSAWLNTMKRNPSLGTSSQEFLKIVSGRAEKLSMNMSEASSAAWQKGILSFPTQFFAYQVRLMENVFGKGFSYQERLRLGLSQFLLYGTAGVPFLAWASDKVKAGEGEAPGFKDAPLRNIIDRGAIDTVIYYATGAIPGEDTAADVMFSQRAGTGHFWTDVIKEMFNMGRFGETSSVGLAGGATFSIFKDTGEDVFQVWDYVLAERGVGPLAQEELIDVARNISTINVALKAYAMAKVGTITSAEGTVLGDDANFMEAFMTALTGSAVQQQVDASASMAWLENRTENKDRIVSDLREIRNKYANNWEDRKKMERIARAYAALIPDELRDEAIAEANRYQSDDFYDSIRRAVEERKVKDEYSRNVGSATRKTQN